MWTRHTAPDGRPYYYNATLKKSSWTMPTDVPGGQPVADGQVWEQHVAPDGRAYFYNRATKQSRWTRPEGGRVVVKAGTKQQRVRSEGNIESAGNSVKVRCPSPSVSLILFVPLFRSPVPVRPSQFARRAVQARPMMMKQFTLKINILNHVDHVIMMIPLSEADLSQSIHLEP